MKIKISVPEIVTLFKEIQKEPSKVFELIRTDVKEMVGNYISELLETGKSVNEIASKYNLLPKSVTTWKKQF